MSKAALACLMLALVAPAAAREPASEGWIFSETASPLDYAPVIIASAWSTGADGAALQLSIQCRRGRTDLVLLSPALTGRAEEHRVTYTVNDGPPAPVAAGAAASGTGLAIRDDVVRLLAGLPASGEIGFQVVLPQAAPIEGRYALAALHGVLTRMAEPCKWPALKPPSQ
jgi:hypothetical protein